MGHPSEAERLAAVLDLLVARDLQPTRVRVGSVEVALAATPPSVGAAVGPEDDAHPTPEMSEAERDAQALAEYEATQYGASEGLDS